MNGDIFESLELLETFLKSFEKTNKVVLWQRDVKTIKAMKKAGIVKRQMDDNLIYYRFSGRYRKKFRGANHFGEGPAGEINANFS